MIIEVRQGQNILESDMKHICFGVNTEGANGAGFAGFISKHYWKELADIGKCELGTCLTHENNGIFYHALVCHSLKEGWNNSTAIIKQCFDAVPTDEEIATISIGTGLIGVLSGADFSEIRNGMEKSSKRIILF